MLHDQSSFNDREMPNKIHINDLVFVLRTSSMLGSLSERFQTGNFSKHFSEEQKYSENIIILRKIFF